MPRKKKEKETVEVVEQPKTEFEQLEERQAYLLDLRNKLTSEKILDLGQLDVLLGQVNQRLEVLRNG